MNSEKTCPSCKEVKLFSEFFSNKSRADGLSGHCRTCHNKGVLRLQCELRNQAIALLGGVCKHCGFSDLRALVFDHTLGGGNKARREEIKGPNAMAKDVLGHPEKYQLLCANCNHLKKLKNKEFGRRLGRVFPKTLSKAEKFCASCGETKLVSEFVLNKARYDGVTVYCYDCHNKKKGEFNRQLRQKINDLLDNKCNHCGLIDSRVFCVDHVNGGGMQDRRDGIRGLSALHKDVIAHPEKYQLLCFNCNQIKKIENEEHGKKWFRIVEEVI